MPLTDYYLYSPSNLVAESATIAFLEFSYQSQGIFKAQQQIKTATEKLADAKAKASQRILDLKFKD